MLTDPPTGPRLLLVGGLTIDEFADGHAAAGGSVLHAAPVAPSAGVVTVSGDEPEARTGLEQLGARLLARQVAEATIRYGHSEVSGRRVLTLLQPGTPLRPETLPAVPVSVVVLAPVAGELPADTMAAAIDLAGTSVGLLQGWLRSLVAGEPVEPLSPSALADPVRAQLARCRALVASTEDLEAHGGDPFRQAAALREAIGPQPVLVLTLGADGFLLDDPDRARVVASVPRRVVSGVPTVGAGDVFGTAMAFELGHGGGPLEAAEAAAEAVVRVLLDRRNGAGS
jgi:sugar/nucleoside kinase (ribokinase family)